MRVVRIIDRYVFLEAFGLFVLGFAGFLGFLIVNKIFLEVESLLDPRIPPFVVVKAVALDAPYFATWSLPVAIVFATLMGMGRLAKDNELTAMFTNGISLYRLFIPFLLLSSIAVCMSYVSNEYLVTRAAAAQQKIYDSFPGLKKESSDVDPFFAKLDNGQFVSAHFFDPVQGRLDNVVYDDWDSEGGRRFIASSKGVVRGEQLSAGLDLRQPAIVYQKPNAEGQYTSMIREPSTNINLGIDLTSHFTDLKTPQELTQADLARQGAQKRKLGESAPVDETEFHLRFSGPFAALAFALVAMPLSLRAPRDERLLGLILCFLLVMLYYFLYFVGKMLGYNGILPPWLGAWMMNIVFGFIALGIIAYSRK